MSYKALLLDRDGVINIDTGYVYRKEDFHFTDGIFDVLKLFSINEYLIFIITNQSGIARGLFAEKDFDILNTWMLQQFKSKGINISRVYYCPYHPAEGIGRYKAESYDRKPNPGMIFKARDEFDLDLKNSILIGDKESDIIAGRTAGVGMNILLSKTESEKSKADRLITNISQVKECIFR